MSNWHRSRSVHIDRQKLMQTTHIFTTTVWTPIENVCLCQTPPHIGGSRKSRLLFFVYFAPLRPFAVLLLRLTDRPFDSKLSWRERRRQCCLPAVHSWRQESYLNNSPLRTCRSHSPLTLLLCVFSQLMLDHIPTPSVHVCLCVRAVFPICWEF